MRAAIAATFGDEQLFVINAFALGAWATGMHVTMSLADAVVVKSVGPDVAKIRNTIEMFGPSYRYLICGYPPFLKRLVDSADLDWSAYRCSAVCGGEGMSEGLRDYLSVAFRPIYSSYGASDLEINIGAETDFTIALRRALATNPALAEALGLPDHSLSPMVFQYNPLEYVIETNVEGELVVTIARPHAISPKIRYNIHDVGRAVPMHDVRRALWETGVNQSVPPSATALPLLFHYGRPDQTVSFYGANVAPGDLEATLFSLPELARRVDSFAIIASEDERANKRLTFALELAQGSQVPSDVDVTCREFLRRLSELNQDYREAARMIPAGLEPTVEFHPHGAGPFRGADVRLKRDYVRTAGTA
jgi:phenylacetate-CoA ligase